MTQDKFRVSEIASDIVDQNVQDFLHENYLDYSYYVIQSRALVHGEGLKPVERRILYSMFTNKCRYNDKTQKAQKIGGTVSGTLHPHSDCLHGDTLFFLSNGKTKKIIDMYRETQKDPTKTYEVYSVNEDGELKLSTLSHARIGQITKEIYKIHLSTGDIVKCTSNHPFMDVNGDFVKAEDLKVGINLKTCFKKNKKVLIAEENIKVTNIQIENKNEEIPMYDFTVEGYENALIQLADSEKLICLHNSSVTETMARLAQRFSMRIPVIDAEGSVGHTTGDEPAAPRYWEARLSKKGQMLVEEIVDDCVDVVPTYDNESTEPVELPVKWPFSIINGSSGISVGYASKLVPHNPDEVMDACIAYVKNEDITNEELNNYIKGPDFPTGGEIVGVDGIKDYFEKGKGTIIVRGSYEVVPLSRGRNNIIFYELPFEISAETIIKNINKKKDDGLFKEISEVKNLSDIKHPERLVITVKSGGNVDKVIDDIFKYTKAENKISINNTILINDVPEQVDMKTIVGAFIDLRKRVVIKRSENKMKKDKHNAMLLDGLLKVSADIDKAIEIIRQSDNKADANKKLCNEFIINEEQADNVLGLSLGKLTKTDSLEIEDKRRELHQSIEKLEKVLTEQDKLSEIIIEELKETKKAISDPRRTKIHNTTIKELKEQQKEKNKINRLLKKNVKVTVLINRNNELKLSVDNEVLNDCDVINVKSTDNLVGIDKNGMLVSVPVKSISFEQFDPSFSDMIGFGKENPDKEDVGLFIATNKGNVSIIKGELKPDKVGVKLNDDEYIIKAKLITKEEYKKSSVLMISDECKRIRFNMSDISGYNAGAGTVSGMNTDGNIIYSDIISEVEGTQNLIVKTNIREIELPVDEFKIQNRAGKGMFLIRLRKNENLKDFSLE